MPERSWSSVTKFLNWVNPKIYDFFSQNGGKNDLDFNLRIKDYNLLSTSLAFNFLYDQLYTSKVGVIDLNEQQNYINLAERLIYKNYYNIYSSFSSFVNISMNNELYSVFKQRMFFNKSNLFDKKLVNKFYSYNWFYPLSEIGTLLKNKWALRHSFLSTSIKLNDFLFNNIKIESNVDDIGKLIRERMIWKKNVMFRDFFDVVMDYNYRLKTQRHLIFLDDAILNFSDTKIFRNRVATYSFSLKDIDYVSQYKNLFDNFISKDNIFGITSRFLWNVKPQYMELNTDKVFMNIKTRFTRSDDFMPHFDSYMLNADDFFYKKNHQHLTYMNLFMLEPQLRDLLFMLTLVIFQEGVNYWIH